MRFIGDSKNQSPASIRNFILCEIPRYAPKKCKYFQILNIEKY
ncbi:hypothetical protein LEP1GSC062_0180 [Leptospira alexanderi serovar Manhao 3 str. L 60]|uniref:Uncharacterized protein n=1 Tax=Leptospira alexanderi serovar Manhao 3 str. L 60 TaxID=1049759 RepID=V6IAA7_9LEPT|nr:hypothetical protein LEP1GSC062_0180 [Leptospira alexanderi serovar Manhao 3 str. L 60]